MWIVLQRGEEYIEQGPGIKDRRSRQLRANRLIRELRRLGYDATIQDVAASGA